MLAGTATPWTVYCIDPQEAERLAAPLDGLQTNEQLPRPASPPFNHVAQDRFPNPIASPQETSFRHSGWMPLRQRVIAALRRVNPLTKRADRLANCGAHIMVQVSSDGQEIRLVSHHCDDRFCIPCQRRIASAICSNLNRLVEGNDIRFLTLTLRHSRTPLAAQIDRLYRSFKELRRRKLWTDRVTAGAAMLELKLSAHDGLWHPHLHVLVAGSFIPAKDLSQAWLEITGDSSIVDIRRPTDQRELVGYVTKYCTKPCDTSVYRSPSALDEAIEALKGRRRCLTFGAWRGTPLEDMPDDGREWQTIDSLDRLLRRAAEGDATALRYVEALLRRIPDLLERWSGNTLGVPPPLVF